jgi:dihydrolipoamide dehydrogenase
MTATYDTVVIGGGPGGYALAIRLGQRGQKVACVEKESVGGVCLNWGCIPSKALITTAQRFDWARHGEALGVLADGVRLDLPRAQQRNRSIVKHHTDGVAGLLKSNGAELVRGTAEIVAPGRVRVALADGSVRELTTGAIVVATGATPRTVRGFEPDGSHVVTAREAVFLEQLPEHLIVLGGGVIGLELGSAYQRLGSRLTVVELTGSLLPGVDADLTRVVHKRLEQNGATILTGTRALGWREAEHGIQVELNDGRETRSIAGSLVLVAAGFVPNGNGVGLEVVGVQRDAQGHVLTDERCASNVPGIFAIGDVAGPPYLAHKAYKEAEVLAEVLTGHDVVRDWRALPAVIFSDPEIATVGVSEAQARAQHSDVVIGKMPFAALGRAQALGETEGFVKLIAQGERLVGAGIVGPEASELVAELTLAIEVGASLEDLALTIHTHPTLAEAVHEAAEHGLGRAVHIMNKKRPAPEARRNVA